jgi:hypothetical protein
MSQELVRIWEFRRAPVDSATAPRLVARHNAKLPLSLIILQPQKVAPHKGVVGAGRPPSLLA